MAQPYVGEIRMFGGNFAPAGWAFCDGQLLPISENETLFQLIGTTYGGDGQSTFALPDLQGRIPIHQGQGSGLSNHTIGEKAGVDSVTLTIQQMPVHNHALLASLNVGGASNPGNQMLAAGTNVQFFRAIAPNANMAANIVGPAGGSQPHENVMPYLCVNFILSLFGIFPSPT
ncbi:MAG: tail fiber protein [Actinomycetota bacterium]|nr:tail fiber protein [Actinomycetota bacterium]